MTDNWNRAKSSPRILFLVTEDWFFRTHRLPLARACRDAGAEVFVMTYLNKPADDLIQEGFHVVPWQVTRGGTNPVIEGRVLGQVVREYRRIRPDLVHHVALKPVIYGGLAARILGIPTVNAVTGLGVVFTSQSARMRVLRVFLKVLLGASIRRKGARTIFQTHEDKEALVKAGIARESASYLIRGSGVDTAQFVPVPEPSGPALVVLPTRMIWSKGVGIFVEAATILQNRGVQARFALVGDPDRQNPNGVSEAQLKQWHEGEFVEWWPHRTDMPNVLGQSNIVAFPSYYGEGVPKILLEASACGRPTITTDSPGCRDAVRDGENGILVPRKDAAALAEAIQYLLERPEIRSAMGAKGRRIAVEEFSIQRVIAETKVVYQSLLDTGWPQRENHPVRASEAVGD
jgi:glycosyltransferase involved in cell wall biosynthesis